MSWVKGFVPDNLVPIFEEYYTCELPLDVQVRYNLSHRFSSGKCHFDRGRKHATKISLVLGTYEPDQRLVALHELAHAVGSHNKHSKAFWAQAIQLYEDAGIPREYYFGRESTYKAGFLEVAYQIFGNCFEYQQGYLARLMRTFMGWHDGVLSWRNDVKISILDKELIGAGIQPRKYPLPRNPIESLFVSVERFHPVLFNIQDNAVECAKRLTTLRTALYDTESTYRADRVDSGWGVLSR